MLHKEYGMEEAAPRKMFGRASLAGGGTVYQQGVSFVSEENLAVMQLYDLLTHGQTQAGVSPGPVFRVGSRLRVFCEREISGVDLRS